MHTLASILITAALTGCATVPAPGPDASWLARQEIRYQPAPQEESFCDVIGGMAASAARACAGGVPRYRAMEVPRQLRDVPEWLPPIIEIIVAQAYDLPSARTHPGAFGDMHAAICRQFMEEGRP